MGAHDVLVVVTDPKASPRVVCQGEDVLIVEDGRTREEAAAARRREAPVECGPHLSKEVRRVVER